jgi:putative membrane protein
MMIYQVDAIREGRHSDVIELMRLAQKRVRRIIIIPGMIGTLGFGTWLMVLTGALMQPWFHVKALLVLVLLAYQAWCWRLSVRLGTGDVIVSSRLLRLMNEVPFFLLVGIVFTVLFKSPILGIRAMASLLGLVAFIGILVKLIRGKKWN